ncbi:MAG: MarR family transcriptional regulator [Burkholderiales bacterium]|nr:MarR family transcriptional regulator [Burkholderiales bacterium]MDE2452243.1 MarR family transcriptional regulator [Burkholderiales bacterium]
MTKRDLSQRFGFVLNEVGRLYGRRFDQLSRQQLGLSRAQVRLLGMVAAHEGEQPISQAELAERLELTPMGVTSLCDRMEAAGWIRRLGREGDRRVKGIELQGPAHEALDAALRIGDALQSAALAGLGAAERSQLLALLRRVHANLSAGSGP